MSGPIERFTLPIPPSTNNLYIQRRYGKGRAKTGAYTNWRLDAGKQVLLQRRRIDAALKHVRVEIDVPFSYKRDIDNVKPILDLLAWMKVVEDDRWVDELRVRRVPVTEPLTVSVWHAEAA
jgi:Holliday junction resolvase RusA-like endonuclease